jgi:hypothetical protein
VVYIATLAGVIVAEERTTQIEQLRGTGTSQMGLELVLSHRRLLEIPLETSSLEIGLLEWYV